MATTKKKGGCCKEQEEKNSRRKLVAAALSTAWFESDSEKESVIDSFAKADLSIQEILMLTEGRRDIAKSGNRTRARIYGSNSKAYSGVG